MYIDWAHGRTGQAERSQAVGACARPDWPDVSRGRLIEWWEGSVAPLQSPQATYV